MNHLTQFNLTAANLFPEKPDAHQDLKCIMVAKVIQEVYDGVDPGRINQESILEEAKDRYEILSTPKRLSLKTAIDRAIRLVDLGASPSTAKEYYSYRVTKKDADLWKTYTQPK